MEESELLELERALRAAQVATAKPVLVGDDLDALEDARTLAYARAPSLISDLREACRLLGEAQRWLPKHQYELQVEIRAFLGERSDAVSDLFRDSIKDPAIKAAFEKEWAADEDGLRQTGLRSSLPSGMLNEAPALGVCRLYRHGAGEILPHIRQPICVDWEALT